MNDLFNTLVHILFGLIFLLCLISSIEILNKLYVMYVDCIGYIKYKAIYLWIALTITLTYACCYCTYCYYISDIL